MAVQRTSASLLRARARAVCPLGLLAMRRHPMGLEVPAGSVGHSIPKRRIGAFPRLVTQAPMKTEHQSFVVKENTGRHVGTSKVKQEPPEGLPLGSCRRLLKRSDQTPYDHLSICRGNCKGPCCPLPVHKLRTGKGTPVSGTNHRPRSRSLHDLRNELNVQARVSRRPVQRQRQQLTKEASLDVRANRARPTNSTTVEREVSPGRDRLRTHTHTPSAQAQAASSVVATFWRQQHKPWPSESHDGQSRPQVAAKARNRAC